MIKSNIKKQFSCDKNKLWNIIGKKVAGKPRESSPVTPEVM